jgi:hypothetical protein
MWEMHYNGSASCMRCGELSRAQSFNYIHGYTPLNSLQQNVAYTRTKRFQKYLNHACMKQGIKSVPDETWKFLLDNGPYKSPGHIVNKLKRAKLKRLPLFVRHLCDNCRLFSGHRSGVSRQELIHVVFVHSGIYIDTHGAVRHAAVYLSHPVSQAQG